MQIMVVIQFQFEGIHKWIDCNIKTVSYLKYPHRHMFHVKCWKEVLRSNREIEIIQLKNFVKVYAETHFKETDKSCEMIALEILEAFNLNAVEVLEDGENGAIVKKNTAD